jgi:signal transduction histidine kinase
LAEVTESLNPKTLEVKDLAGRSYSLRIRPYRTEDNKIDGAVIVLVDLDATRSVTDSLASDYEHAVDTLNGPRNALRGFSAGLLAAQERERRNLALELHDDVTQRLALLELGLSSLERTPPNTEELARHLKTLHEQLGALSERMRRIAHQLHPSMIEDLGPVAALESYIREFNSQREVQVTFQHEKVPGNVDKDVGLCLYRVVQEALHNVLKHSGSKTAQVILKGNDQQTLRLAITDAGSGFDVDAAKSKSGLGLRSMEERAHLVGGTFHIESHPGKGTEVRVTIPPREAKN